MKKKIILSKKFIPEAVDRLAEKFDLVIAEELELSLAGALRENPDAEGLISFLSDPVDRSVIDLGKKLKIIANYAVGYNNIDLDYARQRGIIVCNTPDVLTEATADIAWTLIMACARHLVPSDRYVREGRFEGWGSQLFLGKELHGSRLGIVGMGRIGQATAKRAKGFGMEILYHSRNRKTDLDQSEGYLYRSLDELARESDIVSLHLPYTPDLHHLFDRRRFDLMKPDAIFINTARGQLMDEACLVEKLKRNELFAAGLDVYEFEPRITSELKTLENAVLTPHTGSGTYQTRLKMANKNIADISRVLSGQEALNAV